MTMHTWQVLNSVAIAFVLVYVIWLDWTLRRAVDTLQIVGHHDRTQARALNERVNMHAAWLDQRVDMQALEMAVLGDEVSALRRKKPSGRRVAGRPKPWKA